MLDDFLKEVIGIVIGKQAEEIATLLNNPKHVNEFVIAKKLDITINQARNILYRLSDHGLVSSIRKKDKKKGWYTYFWKMEILKSLEFLKEEKLKRLGQFRNQISNREKNQFYVCLRCNLEYNEEYALLNDFTCRECGDIFTTKDNTKLLKELKKHSDKLEEEIGAIDKEIDIERAKIDKARERLRVKEEKAKKEARASKRAANKKKAEKEKALNKKPVKKKVKKAVKKKPIKKKVKKAVKKVSKKKPIKKKVKKAVKKVSKKKTSKKKR